MLVVSVCVGSACHLKGSYDVIKRLEELIQSHQLTECVELKAHFCMENCSCGTSMRIGEQSPITVRDLAEVDKVFIDQVLPLIGR